MFERIRLGSAAALAVSLTMVGSGIYIATQDTGGGATVDLASSVGSHTPTAPSPDAAADGATRAPAFAEAPAEADPPGTPPRVRPEAEIATPVVTEKSSVQTRPDFEGDPPTQCLGFVYNSPTSVIPIGAESWNYERSTPVDPGKAVTGTPEDMVGGFHIREGGLHLTIDYYDVNGSYVSTHEVDVAGARYYDVSPCHEAYVTVSRLASGPEQGSDLLDVDPASNLPATPEPNPDTAAVQPNFPGIPQG